MRYRFGVPPRRGYPPDVVAGLEYVVRRIVDYFGHALPGDQALLAARAVEALYHGEDAHSPGVHELVADLALHHRGVPYVAFGGVVGGRHSGVPQKSEQVRGRPLEGGGELVGSVRGHYAHHPLLEFRAGVEVGPSRVGGLGGHGLGVAEHPEQFAVHVAVVQAVGIVLLQ